MSTLTASEARAQIYHIIDALSCIYEEK